MTVIVSGDVQTLPQVAMTGRGSLQFRMPMREAWRSTIGRRVRCRCCCRKTQGGALNSVEQRQTGVKQRWMSDS